MIYDKSVRQLTDDLFQTDCKKFKLNLSITLTNHWTSLPSNLALIVVGQLFLSHDIHT